MDGLRQHVSSQFGDTVASGSLSSTQAQRESLQECTRLMRKLNNAIPFAITSDGPASSCSLGINKVMRHYEV